MEVRNDLPPTVSKTAEPEAVGSKTLSQRWSSVSNTTKAAVVLTLAAIGYALFYKNEFERVADSAVRIVEKGLQQGKGDVSYSFSKSGCGLLLNRGTIDLLAGATSADNQAHIKKGLDVMRAAASKATSCFGYTIISNDSPAKFLLHYKWS